MEDRTEEMTKIYKLGEDFVLILQDWRMAATNMSTIDINSIDSCWHLTYILVKEMIVTLDLIRIPQILKPYALPTAAKSLRKMNILD